MTGSAGLLFVFVLFFVFFLIYVVISLCFVVLFKVVSH